MTWSLRLARSFARREMGYDVRTLAVVIDPSGWNTGGFDINPDGLTEVVVLDPLMNATERLATMIDALERLEPEIVLPNYADVCYMATMALQARGGVRSVAIAHSDEPYYQQLATMYAGWNAAVGVSASCAAWLRPIAASMGKPYRTIVYGVPVDEADGRERAGGERGRPLRIAYIGRMVEVQKRIGDLLTLVDGLEELGVRYEMHMVGDGRDLASWKSSLATRPLRNGSVRVHGRRDPAWVERFLPTVDVSVLVSDFEGTSITMLEAMGRGVVPVVTRVSSGVDEWVRDGENGVVVPIGEPRVMAARLAELWRDREEGGGQIEAMGRAAWESARAKLDLDAVAQRYREVFDLAMASPASATPRDLALRPLELTRWTGASADDGLSSDQAACRVLRTCGYERIVSAREAARVGSEGRGVGAYDAVLVGAHETAPRDELIERWREEGLGVAISPGLVACAHERRMGAAIERLVAEGVSRIVLYGTGLHTRRLHRLFRRERGRDLPVVGFMDDRPSEAWPWLFGLPVVHPERVIEELQPHAIVLSSDTYEAQMWDRCEPLRARGLRVVRLYGALCEGGPMGGGGVLERASTGN
jgi:glycosyltransferase involved in cell wall biosynthesis